MKIPHGSDVFVSFSGGKTSAYMCKWIKENRPDLNCVFVFANTGQEHPETYRFIEKVNKWLGLNLICVEYSGSKKGRIYDLRSIDTLTKDGSLFEKMVKNYGIPSMKYAHCTRELKERPMHAFIKTVFYSGYYTAIGIRSDEIDRISSKYEEKKFWYPLAFANINKNMVNEFWENHDFTLNIPEHLGNCVWCWKKSFNKLSKVMAEMPDAFNVPKHLEQKYERNEIISQARYGEIQTFFRGRKSVADLEREFEESRLEKLAQLDMFNNYENSCAESCEPWKEE